LIDGQWVLDTLNNTGCADGSYTQYGSSAHIAWDPSTLAGTPQHTYIVPACGRPPGYTETDKIQIKQASS
jgi:hypothetical protein